MKVVIVTREKTLSENTVRLSNWFKFHDIVPQVCAHDEHFSISGRVCIVTDDMYPSPALVDAIVQEKDVCTAITMTPNSDKVWVPSYILLTSVQGEDITSEVILQYVSDAIDYDPDIACIYGEAETEVGKINEQMSLERPSTVDRCRILYQVVLKYWYKVSNVVVSDYYFHLFVNSYQKMMLTGTNNHGITYDWVKEQSVFMSPINTKGVTESISWAEDHTLKSCVPLGSEVCGYNVEVNETTIVKNHLLYLKGLYRITPKKEERQYDATTTVVGFYYDLGYQNKAKPDYLESIDQYVNLPYPLIFFGDAEICAYVAERRDPRFTLVVERDIESWPLIQRYKKEFQSMDASNGMKKSSRYSLLTCLKVYTVNEAIRLNPFASKRFAWHDPGFYRHKHLSEDIPKGMYLFSEITIPDGKILTTGNIVECTDQDYNDGVETLLAWLMIGDKQAWNNLLGIFDVFVETKFNQGLIRTEQVILTRLVTLYPDLFDIRPCGFHKGHIANVLKNKM